MLNFITYHSKNAPSDQQWLCYIILDDGEPWRVSFVGITEEECKTNATNLWNKEKAKVIGLGYKFEGERVSEENIQEDASEITTHKNAGKVWMVNTFMEHLCRVSPEEVASYEARGYIKGGPRSLSK